MNELYIEDELPLPAFNTLFSDIAGPSLRRKRKATASKSDPPPGDETTGRWTGDEHRLFLEGIMLYGKDWKRMQPLIKTRSLVQIRTHAQKVFKNLGLKKIGPGTVIEAEAAAAAVAASAGPQQPTHYPGGDGGITMPSLLDGVTSDISSDINAGIATGVTAIEGIAPHVTSTGSGIGGGIASEMIATHAMGNDSGVGGDVGGMTSEIIDGFASDLNNNNNSDNHNGDHHNNSHHQLQQQHQHPMEVHLNVHDTLADHHSLHANDHHHMSHHPLNVHDGSDRNTAHQIAIHDDSDGLVHHHQTLPIETINSNNIIAPHDHGQGNNTMNHDGISHVHELEPTVIEDTSSSSTS